MPSVALAMMLQVSNAVLISPRFLFVKLQSQNVNR